MSLLAVLDPLVALALIATAAAYFVEFLRGPDVRLPATRYLLAGTLFLAALSFGAFLQLMGRPPLASPGEAFTLIALTITVVYTMLEFLHGDRSAGFLLIGVAASFQTIGLFLPGAGEEVNVLLRKPWFGAHVVSALLGHTAFAIGAVYSTFFLMLYGDLKHRRFGFVFQRVPPLETLSSMAIRSVTLGFLFLTAAIAVGATGWTRELDHPVLRDPKVVSTIVVWLVYGVALVAHRFTGLRGIRTIGITLAAFVLMVLSSWVVRIVLHTAHGTQELL